MSNFRLLGSIMEKKKPKVVCSLKGYDYLEVLFLFLLNLEK